MKSSSLFRSGEARVKLYRRSFAMRARFFAVVSILSAFSTLASTPGVDAASFPTTPTLLAFQAKLLTTGGTVITGNPVTTFRIYDSLTGGSLLYTDTQNLPTASATCATTPCYSNDGVFSAYVGSGSGGSINLAFNKPYYMEIAIGSETLTPRLQIASVGYSYVASKALGAFTDTGTPSGTSAPGSMYFNTSLNQLFVYDGTSWNQVAGSGTTTVINGTTTISGPTTVTNLFVSSGSSTLSGTTTVSGAATLSGPTTITNVLNVTSTSTFSGITVLSGTTTVSAPLTVNSSSIFNSLVTANAGILSVGSTTVVGNLNVTGTVTLGQLSLTNLSLPGTLNVSGTTTLGPLSAGITTLGQLTAGGNVAPQVNLTYSLGSSSNRFSNAWVGTMQVGTSTGWALTDTGAGTFSLSLVGSTSPAFTVNPVSYLTTYNAPVVFNSNVTSNGVTTLGGNLNLTGNLNIGNGTVTIDASTGNTVINGTLAVVGTTTLSKPLDVNSNKILNLAAPTNQNDAANKAYVDASINGAAWQAPVLAFATSTAPGAPASGDRYILQTGFSGFGTCVVNQIVQWSGTAWTCLTPGTATTAFVNSVSTSYTFNGSAWVSQGSTVNHEALVGLQGGNANEHYHLNLTDYSQLTHPQAQLSALKTTGSPQFASLNVTGTTTIGNSITITGTTTLSVLSAGTSTLGQTTISNFISSGSSTVIGNFTVAGTTTVSSIIANGSSTVVGPLTVTGTATFGQISVNSLSLPGTLQVSGTSTFSQGTIISNYVPGLTSNALYNNNGTLYFNGTAIGGGSNQFGTTTTGLYTLQNLSVGTSVTSNLLTVATGSQAGFRITAGGNVGIGVTAPLSMLDIQNINGTSTSVITVRDSTGNVSFELRPGTASAQNLGIGQLALQSNISGVENNAFGRNALGNNTTGNGNLALGKLALFFNTSGFSNVAAGNSALYSNSSGGLNVSVGISSMLSNTTGFNNTVVGANALMNNVSATSTVAVGFNAGVGASAYANQGGTYLGYQSGRNVATGSDYNTLFGYQAGYNITSGAYNIVLGVATSTTGGVTTGSNNILIGNGVTAGLSQSGNNQLNIGNLLFGTSLTNSSTLSTGNIGIGTASPAANFAVQGSTFLNGNGTVTGAFSVGSLTTGSTTFSGDLLPAANLTYNVGSSSARWNEGWFGSIFLGTSTVKLTSTAGGGLQFQNVGTTSTAITIDTSGNTTVNNLSATTASITSLSASGATLNGLTVSGTPNFQGGMLTFGSSTFLGTSTFAAGIVLSNNVPSVTTNVLYGNAGQLYFNGVPVGASGATSGNLTKFLTFGENVATGDLLYMNNDGKAYKLYQTGTTSVGTVSTIPGNNTDDIWPLMARISDNKYVVARHNGAVSGVGTWTIMVANVDSNGAVTYGTAAEINTSGGGQSMRVFDVSSTGIGYAQIADPGLGFDKIRGFSVNTVTDTITVGTGTADMGSVHNQGASDSQTTSNPNKFLLFAQPGSGNSVLRVIDVTDFNNPVLGAAVTVSNASANSYQRNTLSAAGSDKYIFAYTASNSTTRAGVATVTVSNNTVSKSGETAVPNFGTTAINDVAVVVTGSTATAVFSGAVSSTNTLVAATIDTNTAIMTFGTATSAISSSVNFGSTLEAISTNNFVFAAPNSGATGIVAQEYTVSTIDRSISTVGLLYTLQTGVTDAFMIAAKDSVAASNGLLLGFTHGQVSPVPHKIVKFTKSTTTLNSLNVIGAAAGAYNASTTGTVTLVGGVANNYSSLTSGQQYFIDTFGNLTASNATGVVAGRALSSTELLLGGSVNQWIGIGSNSAYLAGNISVGTTSAPARLTVQSASGGTGTTFGVINASGTSLLTVLDSRNVGVGTSNPSGLLDVGTTSYRSLVVTTSGNVGVGTTSAPSPLFLPTSSSKIREIGNITNTGANMAMQGRYIYTSDSTNKKFNIIDISNPAAPSIVGSMTFGSSDALGRIVVSGKLAFVTATTSPALHIIDISNPTAPVLKSSTSVPSVAFTMAASGKYIYTGNLSSSVQIYDASVPTNPALVYTLPLSTFMSLGMQIRGKYMYVGERDGVNIRLYDISNPSNPSLVSNYVLTGSQFSNMTVEDKYVYAIVVTASGGRDLQILDYSNPTSPTLVNTISLNSTANLPVVKGRYLYMTGSSGISVYDLVNPSSPTLSAVIPTNTVNYFEVAGRLLYYIESSGSGQVRVLDIGGAFLSNIESATMDTGDLQVRELLTAASARFSDLAIMNQGALINTRFDVVGTSSFIGNIGIGTGTPTAALHFLGTGTGIRFADGSLMTTASIGSANSMANVTDLVMNADSDANSSGAVRLQTAATDRLYITNVGNVGIGTNTPAQLLVVGSQSARSLTFNGNTGSLNVVGNVGIGTVTAPTSALSVQGNITAIGNISSLANANLAPTFVSSASTGGSIKNLVIQGRYAYLAQASGGTANLYIYDVTRSTNPALITSLAVGSSNGGVGIKVQGKYAYIVSAGDDTLRIVDISNPATPYIVGSINSGDDPWEVFVQGKYAYVANGTGQTMQIVDISNPTAPVLAGSVGSLGANSRRVVVQGRYAYVSNNAGQVFVIDISNPSAPATIVTYTPGCSAFDLAAQGRYLYLACGNGELRIVDIKNPASPSATSTTVVDGIELDAIHVSGRYVYLGAHSNQSNFYVLDVSNPSLPVKVGTLVSAFGLNAYINAIEVSGRYAYIATDSGTFNVVDVSGAEFTSALVHSLESGNIQSRGDIFAQGNMNAGSSLFVGQGGILSAGGLSIVSTSTHSYFGGNVGIGTSTPSLTFVVGSQTARSLFFDANTGNFGIGTSAPTATLAVGGSMFVAGSSTHMNGINLTAGCFAVNGNCFVQGTSSQWGAIGTSTSIYYTLGNVGIGTTTPNALFTVTGTSLIQGLTVGLGFNSIASNSAFGVSALSSNTSGQFNTALGYQALRFNTTGQSNTATGYQALVSNSSGQANTAYGLQSLNSSSTGSYNVGMGNYALFNNTTGRKNVAVGYQALYDLNILDGSDSNNTAIGFNTGLGILTGKNNTIIGANVTGLSSTLSDNIIIADGNGNQRINVTGSGNLGIGTSTPQSLFIVGSQTGRSLAFDANNAFVGIGTTTGLSYALDIQKFSYSPEGIRVRNKGNGSGSAAAILFEINDSATTPFRIQANSSANTAYGGAYSLNMVNDYNAPITFNTQVGEVLRVTGNGNVGIGTITPQAVLTVGSSTAVHGSGAGLPKLFAVGGTQTGNMFTVTNNGLVGIGIASPSYSLDINASTYSDGMRIQTNRIFSSINLINNSSGGHSWFISSHGGSSPGAGTLAFYDQTAAEYRMQINGSGNLRLNAYGAGTLVTDASGNVTASSDERLKNITGTFTRGLAEVLELNPIVYTWNTLSGMETATAYSGFSAQNIQAHIPEAVSQDTRGYLTLQDRPLLAALVNAVKELASSASEQQKQINDLQTAISKVSPKLAGLDVLLGSDETLAQRLEQLESRILNLESKFASLDAALKAAGSNGQIQISNFTGGVVADLTATGAVRFLQDVAMEGHLLVSNDTAGKATVTTGTSTVHVAYAKPYASKPNVTISLKTPIKLDWYVVKNETETGFDIEIAPVVAVDVEFTWISLGVAVVPDSDGRQNGEQVANPDYQVGPPPTSDPLNVGSDSQSRVPATATHADTEDTSATADVLSPTDSSLSNPSDIGPIGSISNPVSTSNSDTTTEVSIQQ